MSPNKTFFATSQVSSKPNKQQHAYNTSTTKCGGLTYDFIIYNYPLSIFKTAF